MLNLTELLNQVVSIKTESGLEYIGKLVGLTEDKTVISVQNLKTVFLSETGQVMVMPFLLTSDEEIININMNSVFTIVKSNEAASNDYLEEQEEDATAV